MNNWLSLTREQKLNIFTQTSDATGLPSYSIEKDAWETVYDFLKNQNIGTVYFQPKDKEIERYIFENI